ncbi:MAG: hypothetical protein HY326_10770 [Chloroflexi bacterium]|nr:hypothetical protein [Chloroflexota bacterium]
MSTEIEVGRVLRASTQGFTVGCLKLGPDVPIFGSLVKAPIRGDGGIYGLVYDVTIQDDPFVRQLLAAPNLSEETILDQRQRRQVPYEISVLVVGYLFQGAVRRYLPPQPPETLNRVYTCAQDEVQRFHQRFDHFRTILQAREIPADELISAGIRQAAESMGPNQQRYLLEAGRELARLLNDDLIRLSSILNRIRMS